MSEVVRGTRRADRLRRNPFVVIVVGFLVLFGGMEGVAAVAIAATDGSPWLLVLAALAVAALAILVYWGLITRFLEGRTAAPELAVTTRTPRLFLGGLALAIVVMTVCFGLIAVIGGVDITAGKPWLAALGTSLGLAIMAGVIEELFLRGVLFRVTEQHLGTWLGLVVSALFFGLLHLANPDASLWRGSPSPSRPASASRRSTC